MKIYKILEFIIKSDKKNMQSTKFVMLFCCLERLFYVEIDPIIELIICMLWHTSS